jgi:dTDP-4-amino-4,6-dideoxygalactose transaminase
MRVKRVIEEKLCALYGYEYAVLVGHARSGIVAAVDALSLRGQVALIPSNVCSVVVSAFISSGMKVEFVCVNENTGFVDEDSFIELMEKNEGGVVMPIHLYGGWYSYYRLRDKANELGWRVFENDTLIAARLGDGVRPIGDVLITSFGYAKTISVGEGGAVLTNDPLLSAKINGIVSAWPKMNNNVISAEHRVMLSRRSCEKISGIFNYSDSVYNVDRKFLRFSISEEVCPEIIKQIDNLDEIILMKSEVMSVWLKELTKVSDYLMVPKLNITAPWRLACCFYDGGARDVVVDRLRGKGVDVGVNFPVINDVSSVVRGKGKGGECSSGKLWGERVVNFWLSSEYKDRVEEIVGYMVSVLDEYD